MIRFFPYAGMAALVAVLFTLAPMVPEAGRKAAVTLEQMEAGR